MKSIVTLALVAWLQTAVAPQTQIWPREADAPSAPKPAVSPAAFRDLLGEYESTTGSPARHLILLEQNGALWTAFDRDPAAPVGAAPAITRDARGRVAQVVIGGLSYQRLQVGPEDGSGQLKVTPVGDVATLLASARTASPPVETGTFKDADLVELVTLDRTIHLDIRYATTNNFLGSVFYAQARAFLQRPAAEALVRAHRALAPLGYGLLIHDGYRPWFVTKTFWDATPDAKKWLVANPANGSRHNRGAAVDVTLYDLKTGRAVEMPSTYDESTERAFAFYPGGTSLERWHRALLRRMIEREGFTVNPEEWWHFDFQDWKSYRIGNIPFEALSPASRAGNGFD